MISSLRLIFADCRQQTITANTSLFEDALCPLSGTVTVCDVTQMIRRWWFYV